MDEALTDLVRAACGDGAGIAFVAVGGYGRAELSPHSDIDLLIVGRDRRTLTALAPADIRNVLYPLWDAGFQVGHALVTPKDAIERARGDLHALTALLTARRVAGADDVFEELIDRRTRWIERDRKKLVRRLLQVGAERDDLPAAGWVLAPDVKEDRGGLRDIAWLGWLATVAGTERPDEQADSTTSLASRELAGERSALLAAREALHSLSGRRFDRLRMDLQPQVADVLGIEGDERADVLMAHVHSAARRVEHVTATFGRELARRALGGPRRSGALQHLGEGVVLDDGELNVGSGPPHRDAALWLLAARARTGRPLAPAATAWLSKAFGGRVDLDRGEVGSPGAEEAGTWSTETLAAFLEVLRGRHVEGALQELDHHGGMTALLPHWGRVRALAQHDPYHRRTVDGHSFRAVAELHVARTEDELVRRAVEEAGSDRVLLVATLLHDIGKGAKPAGGPHDHSELGAILAGEAAGRMGFSSDETGEIAMLVRHHLLLADTATRRDLEDGAVIQAVSDALGSARLLRLLFALTQADARATGPEAWSPWKAALVAELYRKCLVALETGSLPPSAGATARVRELSAYDPLAAVAAEDLLADLPPSYFDAPVEILADELRMLRAAPGPGRITCRIQPANEETMVTLCMQDRPGALARTAGVLTLHRLGVLRARTYSTAGGLALQRLTVKSGPQVPWETVERDLADAFSGRLDIQAKVERKITDYRPPHEVTADVRVLQNESAHSTVLEVRVPDALGVLYAITSALAQLDVDIHVAKIDTLGARAVDVFYARSIEGNKLDRAQANAAEAAICYRIQRLFG